jgi:hypothetical protein
MIGSLNTQESYMLRIILATAISKTLFITGPQHLIELQLAEHI